MKRLLPTLSLAAAFAAATEAFGADIELSSSTIPLPAADGSFSEVSSMGYPVRHIYYMLSEEEFNAYTNAPSPTEAIYNAFLAGELGEACLTNAVITTGFSDIYLSEVLDEYDCPYSLYYEPGDNAYFAAIYTYTNETTGAFYYIAQPTNTVTLTDEEIDALPTPFGAKRWIYDIAINAGRWEVVEPRSFTVMSLAKAERAGRNPFRLSAASQCRQSQSRSAKATPSTAIGPKLTEQEPNTARRRAKAPGIGTFLPQPTSMHTGRNPLLRSRCIGSTRKTTRGTSSRFRKKRSRT